MLISSRILANPDTFYLLIEDSFVVDKVSGALHQVLVENEDTVGVATMLVLVAR